MNAESGKEIALPARVTARAERRSTVTERQAAATREDAHPRVDGGELEREHEVASDETCADRERQQPRPRNPRRCHS
jgi:hypothetical protein